MGNVDFYTEKLSVLSGGVIVGPMKDHEEEFFGLQIKKDGKLLALWILSDDEGNGPGSFEIVAPHPLPDQEG